MKFADRLRAIRKEHGISQEELAYKLKVSRQAVSKWENDQGFPEMDKLLSISKIFGVSLDYLLKDDGSVENGKTEEAGYYLDSDTVEKYLDTKKWRGSRIALGVAVMIFSLSFAIYFDHPLGSVLFFLGVAVGISILVMLSFQPKFNGYEEIEERPLTFEPNFLRIFEKRYAVEQRKSGFLIVSGIVIFVLSLIVAVLIAEYTGNDDRYIATLPILWGVAVGLLIQGGTIMEAINVIAKNEAHVAELRKTDNGRGWIYAIVMPLATMVFLAIGFIWNAWHPGWLVFPVASLLCYGYTMWGGGGTQTN